MTTIALPAELHAIEKLREEELEEARSIQSVMLPVEPLRTSSVRISHAFQPVTEVGGDFLDYFELTDGCYGLYLGDVSGKGLPAAMYAALAVGTLRGVHKTGMCPSQVLSTLNRRLMIRGTPRRHAAVQYAMFDPRTRVMKIVERGDAGTVSPDAEGLPDAGDSGDTAGSVRSVDSVRDGGNFAGATRLGVVFHRWTARCV